MGGPGPPQDLGGRVVIAVAVEPAVRAPMPADAERLGHGGAALRTGREDLGDPAMTDRHGPSTADERAVHEGTSSG